MPFTCEQMRYFNFCFFWIIANILLILSSLYFTWVSKLRMTIWHSILELFYVDIKIYQFEWRGFHLIWLLCFLNFNESLRMTYYELLFAKGSPFPFKPIFYFNPKCKSAFRDLRADGELSVLSQWSGVCIWL